MGSSSIPPPPSPSWGCSTGPVLNRVRYCTQSSPQWDGTGLKGAGMCGHTTKRRRDRAQRSWLPNTDQSCPGLHFCL